ncbi:MAG: hypothetical protein HQ449_03360 [Chitinophagaceae bacterium]|nr:hypothetical protein [Chitinophagaceae bacterium]
MAKWIISLKNIFKLIPKSWIMDANVFTKVELIVEISFETFGQVQYKDENGRPWIKEFSGSKWVKELYFRELGEVSFSVFVNNQYLKEGRHLKLIKKINNEIIDQAEFQLSGDKLFEGWFKLG